MLVCFYLVFPSFFPIRTFILCVSIFISQPFFAFCPPLSLSSLSLSLSYDSRWHVTCKDRIIKEIDHLRDDYASYASGDVMLLTYEDDANALARNDGNGGGVRDVWKSRRGPKVHRPRSMLFRAVVGFNLFAKTSRRRSSTSIDDVADRWRGRIPSFGRKGGVGVADDDRVADGEAAGGTYDPPTIVYIT